MKTREEIGRASELLQIAAESLGGKEGDVLFGAVVTGMLDALDWMAGQPNTGLEDFLGRAEAIAIRHEKAASN